MVSPESFVSAASNAARFAVGNVTRTMPALSRCAGAAYSLFVPPADATAFAGALVSVANFFFASASHAA